MLTGEHHVLDPHMQGGIEQALPKLRLMKGLHVNTTSTTVIHPKTRGVRDGLSGRAAVLSRGQRTMLHKGSRRLSRRTNGSMLRPPNDRGDSLLV